MNQAEKRKAIRRLDEAYKEQKSHEMLSSSARQYIDLDKRPKDFPIKRIDALNLMFLEGIMPPVTGVEPDDDDIHPLHVEYFDLLRKIDNYET